LPGSPTPGRCRGPVNLQFHTFRGSEALFQGMNGISIAQKSRGGNVKISANPPFKDQNRVKRNNLPVGHRIATLPPRNAIVGRLHVSSRPPAERSGPSVWISSRQRLRTGPSSTTSSFTVSASWNRDSV
jgi:hypothetical protein